MIYTFDDYSIGLTSNNEFVEVIRIVRPSGLTNRNWYNFASKICLELNGILDD